MWKTPRLSFGANKGLQCGLSGNRVQALATCLPEHQRETTVTGNGRLLPGEIQPDLSRKIYLICRRIFSFQLVVEAYLERSRKKFVP